MLYRGLNLNQYQTKEITIADQQSETARHEQGVVRPITWQALPHDSGALYIQLLICCLMKSCA